MQPSELPITERFGTRHQRNWQSVKKNDLSIVLKNISYSDLYDELEQTQTYNLKMIDGALIQMMYRFNHEIIETHRLAFFPSPLS